MLQFREEPVQLYFAEVGGSVGWLEGIGVGALVGDRVGWLEGTGVGAFEGRNVGGA